MKDFYTVNFTKKGKDISDRWVQRYIKFIEYCKTSKKEDNLIELHHIFPKKIYPEIEKNSENLIVLTSREHYLAHFILAKIFGGTQWIAFQLMKRVIKGQVKNSILFAKSRKYVIEQTKLINKGKVHDDNFRKNISQRFKNKILVFVKDELNLDKKKYFFVDLTDENYLTGNYLAHGTGRTHNKKTKELMSKNGIKDKKSFYNPENNHCVFLSENEIPPKGYILGNPFTGESSKKRFEDTTWATDTISGNQVRIKKKDIDGIEFVKTARKFNNKGFSLINDKNLKIYLNIETKEKKYLRIDEYVPETFIPCSGVPFKNLTVVVLNNELVFISSKAIRLFFTSNANRLKILKAIEERKSCEFFGIDVKYFDIENFEYKKGYKDGHRSYD